MRTSVLILGAIVTALASLAYGQRIQTVEVGESRYFVSNASPYSPTLNWFLAYEYCRTIGMELLSFQNLEEAEAITAFLNENGHGNSDYWTSGNQLGSEMWIWMSTGQPFNSTFHFWAAGGAPLTKSQQSCTSTQKGIWSAQNCMDAKPFICEQTRCFYYNYVTTNRRPSQGRPPTLRPVRPLRQPTFPTQSSLIQSGVQQHSVNFPSTPITNSASTSTTPLPKFMTTVISQNTKIMPTTPPPTPQQGLKEMPVSEPPSAVSDAAGTVNNEIIPDNAPSELLVLQPPTEEFEPEQTEQPPPASVVTLLSRQETFSWALKDTPST